MNILHTFLQDWDDGEEFFEQTGKLRTYDTMKDLLEIMNDNFYDEREIEDFKFLIRGIPFASG